MLTRLLAIVLAAASLSAQTLQPPAPGSGNANRAAQSEPQSQRDQAAPVQPLGPAQIPTQISIAPTFVQEAPQRHEEDNGSGTLADWWMVGLTGLIAALTFTLAVIAGVQFRSQHLSTQEALKIAREANETSKKANAQSLVLLHRPRLVIRNVDIDLSAGFPTISYGKVWASNTGATPAQVIRFDSQWFFGERLPRKNPFVRIEATTVVSAEVPAGGTKPFTIASLTIEDVSQHSAIRRDGPVSLYLIGIVKYVDALNTLRVTAFCRRYDPASGRFKKVEDEDYEYAD